MEFRFAATQLRLPLIVVVVGTGNTWETTEVQSACYLLTGFERTGWSRLLRTTLQSFTKIVPTRPVNWRIIQPLFSIVG